MTDPAASAIDLVTWHAVHDLSFRYAEAIDRRRWDDLLDVFDTDVTVDFSSFTHRPASGVPMAAVDWVTMVRSTIDGFTATQHLIGNHRITVDGPDDARYTAYVQAQHWMDRERWYLVGGWYENRAVRRADGWKLASVTINQTWDAGDRNLLREASARAAGR